MNYTVGKPIILLSFFWMTGAALAQDDDSEKLHVPQSCVNNNVLRSPLVIDNSTIVFTASRKRLYLNRLPSNCVGLKTHGRISYQKSSRLCADDWFYVLERAGTLLQLGMSCRFGNFELITEEDLENLRNPKPVTPEPQPVTPPDIEDVGED